VPEGPVPLQRNETHMFVISSFTLCGTREDAAVNIPQYYCDRDCVSSMAV
jgi:hypothetical protein